MIVFARDTISITDLGRDLLSCTGLGIKLSESESMKMKSGGLGMRLWWIRNLLQCRRQSQSACD